jgi:peptidoglycan/xylan/chitin deacetylase (PgdA/CDA1 family)
MRFSLSWTGLRGLRRRRRPRGIVLCYHRVASLYRDPQLLAVTPEHFVEQLDYLSERFELVALARMGESGHTSLLPVAITFDDGYADNLIAAKPLLEERQIPATVFVCTGNLGTRREFWWDDLERILLEPETLPERLELTMGTARISRELSNSFSSAPSWNVLDPSDPSPRHSLYREVVSAIRPLPPHERDGIVAELRTWAGVDQAGRESHRSLTEDEVSKLGACAYVEIGAHTLGHPVLAALDLDAQRAEIETSRDVLRDLTNGPVDSFAYPYGSLRDYDSTTVRILKETGFTMACTTTPEPVVESTQPLRTPRILVRDWDTAGLRRRLEPFIPR